MMPSATAHHDFKRWLCDSHREPLPSGGRRPRHFLENGKAAYHQLAINWEAIGPLLGPGASIRLPIYPLRGKYPRGAPDAMQLNGVAFTDGTTAGPNTC